MNFDLSDDQQLLMTAFEGLLERYRRPPEGVHGYVAYSSSFQAEVAEAGFLEILSQPGFGVLEGALMVEAAATCPFSVELAGAMLIAPLIGTDPGPLAVAWRIGDPIRYLEQARSVCVFNEDDVLVGTPSPSMVRHLDSVVAYPLAVLTALPVDCVRFSGVDAAAIRRRALIGIAAEAAGLMRGALDQTVEYVKERQQFGQPLGHFQAIQHRLAEDAQLVRATRWLALRAAFADDEAQASLACLYAQEAIRKVINDCHQFTGAMGLTLEYPLHLWTYRLKHLQGEAGGKGAQAHAVAQSVWGVDEGEDLRSEMLASSHI